jgi:hypothetical protein
VRHVGSEYCDVVVGWGPAGAGAAVGAGQAGARTLLLEAAGCLAGAATLTYHDHTAAAAAFVDATGECDLAWFAGASTRYGNHGFVNAPRSPVHSCNKDGPMACRHAGSQPVYAPDSYRGPQADPDRAADLGWSVEAAERPAATPATSTPTTTASPSRAHCTAR